jgi:uncharacterized membrane protein
MAFLTAAFAFLVANWSLLLGILATLAGVGAVIAKLTPSPKDDRVFATILRFLNLVPVPAVTAPPESPESDGEEPPIMS